MGWRKLLESATKWIPGRRRVAQRIELLMTGVEELIRPIIDMVQRGRWNLDPATDTDVAQLTEEIRQATEREVSKVILISWDNAPEWMTRESFLRAIDDSIGESIGEILRQRFKQKLETEWKGSTLGEKLGASGFMKDITVHFMTTFGGTVETVLKFTFGDVLGGKFRHNLQECYLLLLAAVIAGDEAEVRRDAPLMRRFARAYVCGTKKGEPTVWLVLVR